MFIVLLVSTYNFDENVILISHDTCIKYIGNVHRLTIFLSKIKENHKIKHFGFYKYNFI